MVIYNMLHVKKNNIGIPVWNITLKFQNIKQLPISYTYIWDV